MRETEITIQIFEDLESIFKKVRDSGFEEDSHYYVNDWYFSGLDTSHQIEYNKLLKNSFLLRQIVEENEITNYLVYKDKEIDENGNVLSEDKIKVTLSSIDDALKVFKKSNTNCWCELHQSIYVVKKGKIKFTIQQIQDLGNFIEYEEDESMKDMSTKEKREFMLSQIQKLNLDMSSSISCKKVYMKYLQGLNNKDKTIN